MTKQIGKYDDGDNFFFNMVGFVSGLMICIGLIIIFYMLICNAQHANAGELDAWEFNIMGINPADFEGREILPILGGVVVSFAVHEAGHVVSGRLMGTDAYFDFHDRVAYAGDGYNDWSDDQKALFSGAGFIAQTLVGGILTAIPKTRHSDFTLGFNVMSSITGFSYAFTGGLGNDDYSDVKNLDKYGYHGTETALTSGFINGVFTYYSLDKAK